MGCHKTGNQEIIREIGEKLENFAKFSRKLKFLKKFNMNASY